MDGEAATLGQYVLHDSLQRSFVSPCVGTHTHTPTTYMTRGLQSSARLLESKSFWKLWLISEYICIGSDCKGLKNNNQPRVFSEKWEPDVCEEAGGAYIQIPRAVKRLEDGSRCMAGSPLHPHLKHPPTN